MIIKKVIFPNKLAKPNR